MKIYRRLLLLISAAGIYQLPANANDSSLRGHLTLSGIQAVFPGDPAYPADSQAYNLRFKLQPAAVLFPTSIQQVAEVVKIGAAYHYPVVARSGGHSYIANGLGGQNGSIVVDLRNFKTIEVDSSSGIATIGTGNRLGDIALALNSKGRALPHGTCPYVGIGGHSSFGGFGFTSRAWGLTLDTVQSVEAVLPNGTIATLSHTEGSDIFWGIKGAAPSFGISTSIRVQTFPVPPSTTLFNYTWAMDPAEAAKAVETFQKFIQSDLPPEFGAEFRFDKGKVDGQLSVSLFGGWYGPAKEYNATIKPWLSTLRQPDVTIVTAETYIESVNFLGGKGTLTTSAPDNTDTFYVKSLMTPPLSPPALKAFASYLAHQGFHSDTSWFVGMELWGGVNSAINAVAQNATAFGHRHSTWTFQFYSDSFSTQPPYPADGFAFVRGMVDSILDNSPHDLAIGAYPNYADNMLPNWQKLYYGDNYPRLRSLKKRVDPHNVFRFTESIQE